MNELVQYSATEMVAKIPAREVGAVELLNAQRQIIEANIPDFRLLQLAYGFQMAL
jgi:hypothetical protein